MSLLVRPHAPTADGVVVDVTPDSAGWTYVGFRVVKMMAGQRYDGREVGREACLVVLSGTVAIEAGGECHTGLGGRKDVFDGAPTSVYLPAGMSYVVTAETDAELAVCTAPSTGQGAIRVLSSDAVEHRGSGTNTRHVRNILSDADDIAESLLVVEVVTPGGNWSSYPPHKHDRDAIPEETLLEETYYHRLSPPQGFAFQRVYTDARDLDETMAVHDGDVVLVPRGYHPVGAPHGYDLYYLNVMAGPVRKWVFHNDPAHDWIVRR
jgi:5-deoxy-glucuronate isomerase